MYVQTEKNKIVTNDFSFHSKSQVQLFFFIFFCWSTNFTLLQFYSKHCSKVKKFSKNKKNGFDFSDVVYVSINYMIRWLSSLTVWYSASAIKTYSEHTYFMHSYEQRPAELHYPQSNPPTTHQRSVWLVAASIAFAGRPVAFSLTWQQDQGLVQHVSIFTNSSINAVWDLAFVTMWTGKWGFYCLKSSFVWDFCLY